MGGRKRALAESPKGKVGSGRWGHSLVRRARSKNWGEWRRKQRRTKEEKDQKERGNGGMGGAQAGRRGSGFFPEKARPGSLESRPREGRGWKWELGDSSGKWAPGHGSKKWVKRRRKERRTEEGKDQKGPGIGGRGGARARRRQSRLLPRKIRSGFLKSRPREGRGRESWEWAMQV